MIDVHGHLIRGPRDLDWIVEHGTVESVWLHALPELPEPFYPDQPDVVFATDREVLDAAKRHPHFFVPFGYLDFREPPEAIDAQHEAGFVGLKAIFAGQPYDHPSHLAHYERAEALGMPILFHMGGLGPVRSAQLGQGLSARAENMRPCQLATIAGEFPQLTLVGAHLGGLWQSEVLEGIREYANLYFDISGGNTRQYVEWIMKHMAYEPVPEKILAGIDACYGRRTYHQDIVDKASFWKLFFRFVNGWRSKGDEAERILKLNALGIMDRTGQK